MKLVQTTANALRLRTLPVISPETDTGARLIVGQVGTAVGDSYDQKWIFVDGPTGNGWASADYLTPVTALPPTPKWPKVPTGSKEIFALFGLPCKPDCSRGSVTLPASLPLGWNLNQRVTIFECHILLAPVFTNVFQHIHSRGLWPLLEDYGGCYNCRSQRGTTKKISTHSWGIGIDLNMCQNPLRAKPKMPQKIIDVFADHGFTWGGTWSRPDGMHFQYAKGY